MSRGPRVYLAAALERRGELRTYARLLARRGVRVVARWLDYDNVDADLDADGRARAAWECVADLQVADLVLVFTPAEGAAVGYQTGGRHVELGIAIGLEKPIVIIGPAENVFHAHGGPWQGPAWAHFHRFASFAECLDAWESLLDRSPRCAICGSVATCFGAYDGGQAAYACDGCCGHSGEDGKCEPIGKAAPRGGVRVVVSPGVSPSLEARAAVVVDALERLGGADGGVS